MPAVSQPSAAARPQFRQPLPSGVLEQIGPEPRAIVPLGDAALLSIGADRRRCSADAGASWTDDGPFAGPPMGSAQGLSCVRLRSGGLALAHHGREQRGHGAERFNWNPFYLSLSVDDGRTWHGAHPMQLLGGPYDRDAMVQLSSGRLLMPSRICHSNNAHPGLEYDRASSWGTWHGRRVQVSGHYHYPEIDIASVSWSDDEGQTWQQGDGQLMGWFDADGIPNGRGGVTAVDEPAVAECADGRVLLMARSTVGRLVQTYSEDGGQTWGPVLPADLSSSYSPCKLVRVPATGDLLCVWNQVSRDEIRRGFRRGRLSAAISQDNGASWTSHRTIELSEGLELADRVPPSWPLRPIVALPELGALPAGFATFDYPAVWFAGDHVLLAYHRSWIAPGEQPQQAVTLGERQGGTASKPRESVLRRYPLTWFYGA